MSDKIKELFVTQYWGQKVYKPETVSDPMEVNIGDMGSGYLLLRSVGQLTDEEKLQVGIVAFPMFVPFPEKDYDTLRKLALTVLDRGHLGSRAHQTLVRYGVLAPFTYLDEENKPVTIQPEEILKRGWAKYQGICKKHLN